ncbi:hypothetical protein [Bradyrhizobium sp. USDA 329]|uniref:hypothetical protein n=1 Tax=unclassified Bradyrhizobium TaxID=2631580 RepID=UPI00351965A8
MITDMAHDSTLESREHRLLMQAWECAFAGTSIVYLSGPITTGPRFVRWYSEVGKSLADRSEYAKALREHVIEPNNKDLQAAATRLRLRLREPVLEPASLNIAEWSQVDYLTLWDRVIERFAGRVVLLPGWNFSAGCAAELSRAIRKGLPIETIDGSSISVAQAIELLSDAAGQVAQAQIPIPNLRSVADQLTAEFQQKLSPASAKQQELVRKDASLDRLAELINVAQFVSFSPRRALLRQEFSRVLGLPPNYRFQSLRHALGTLLERSAESSINLRSYTPESPQSREFIYGIKSLEEAVAAAERLGSEGLYVIANETVDIHDGGVSGVIMDDVVEFAPDDTPRGVEKPGVASLPRHWGLSILGTVYGFAPDLNVPRTSRLEFSIHPKPRGWRNSHTLGWEYVDSDIIDLKPKLSWPNRFSRMIGDKVYGLLVAHSVGLPVPRTTVVNRRVAPFVFGQPTGSDEVWLRTSPTEQIPGKFTTRKGWADPFRILQNEDPAGTAIASVLCQAAVPAFCSGAAIVTADDELVVEGASGEGEAFMKGEAGPERLPATVAADVEALYRRAAAYLGPVRFEWVHDGRSAWIVQLHRGATQSTSAVLVPGDAEHWIPFDVTVGLEQLRSTVSSLDPGAGLILRGDVGLTSHIADVIRRAGVPARISTG